MGLGLGLGLGLGIRGPVLTGDAARGVQFPEHDDEAQQVTEVPGDEHIGHMPVRIELEAISPRCIASLSRPRPPPPSRAADASSWPAT